MFGDDLAGAVERIVEHLFNTDRLRVGDIWPQRWLRYHGPIVRIDPGGLVVADAVVRGYAKWADGQGITLLCGGQVPVTEAELAEWQAARDAQFGGVDDAR